MDEDGRIRNHRNRAGDADAVNDYENVKKGDDESIDDDASEVGWNSDDEVAFHSTATYRKNKSSKHLEIESEEEPDEEDEDEDLANGGILLSDLLFKNLTKASNSKKEGGKEVDPEDGSEDDEYGSDESDGDDGSDVSASQEEDGSGDDDEDQDLEEVHSRLLNAIDRFAKPQTGSSTTPSSGKRHNNQNTAESAFSAAADSGDVSMSALLGALDNTRGLSVVKKHLADLEKGLAAPVHVEKVVADRMERSQVYAGSKEEMNRWQGTVVQNRHVGTLDLAHDKRQIRSFKAMVNRFVPTTDMEKEIQMVLVKHGATDQDAEQREVDELQGRNMSLQEIREKQAELAKVKALMFYDQMKRHRMNKIKSKAYRKIQKKKKLKQGEGVDEDADDEDRDAAKEKEAFNRVRERMDMRHKNTSKWAKKALQFGHTDKSLR
jgi:U3 small nucleolar RNA-associated protein 14